MIRLTDNQIDALIQEAKMLPANHVDILIGSKMKVEDAHKGD